MIIGGRKLSTILGAFLQRRHYRALKNMISVYNRPLQVLWRYISARGKYPWNIKIKTPMGRVEACLYSHHDLLTVNEIFCRGDYSCSQYIDVVVDFGSNIGISALYFLTRNHHSYAYLFEPLPINGEKLARNLKRFEKRYSFEPVAVGLSDGQIEFGFEETGRYGGIGSKTGSSMLVPCKEASKIIEGVIEKHGKIDVLKIDIETLEKDVLLSIHHKYLENINSIFIEHNFSGNPLPEIYDFEQYGSVARFTNLA